MYEGYLPMMDAAIFLRISRVKLARMVQDGDIKCITAIMDKRTKLFSIDDLKKLKEQDHRVLPEK